VPNTSALPALARSKSVGVVRLDNLTMSAAVTYNVGMLDRASATPSAGGYPARSKHYGSLAVRAVLLSTLASLGALSAASSAADAPSNGAPSVTPAPSAATALTARAQALFAQGNQFWTQTFNAGGSYSPAELAFFNSQIKNACNDPGPLTGSFYCPDDLKVYLDQSFLEQVEQHSPAVSDFALGYLVGHELGLHIQNLVGTTDLVEQARSNSAPAVSQRTWMTQELQADCYAGLWMRWALIHAGIKPISDSGAALEAVREVSAERYAHLAPGETMVDPVQTYGTSALRAKWFQRGLDDGTFNDCDTFSAAAAGKL
jgi:predicted metalloprotease